MNSYLVYILWLQNDVFLNMHNRITKNSVTLESLKLDTEISSEDMSVTFHKYLYFLYVRKRKLLFSIIAAFSLEIEY